MKKILSLLTILASTSTTSLTVVACDNSSSKSSTYNSTEDAIKSLSINCYSKVSSKISNIARGIKNEILNNLVTLNFATKSDFDFFNIMDDSTKLTIDPIKIINTSTNSTLVDADLVSVKTLSLNVTVTYNDKDILLKKCNLIIKNQTDQEISDYIKNFDFNSFFQSKQIKFFLSTGLFQINDFTEEFKGFLTTALGSYYNLYIEGNDNNLNISSIKKGNNNVTQDDLNRIGDLNLTIVCQYKELEDITLNIKLTLNKINISKLSLPLEDISIQLDSATNNNLTPKDVTKITDEIKTEILSLFNNLSIFIKEGTDYKITGINDTVKVGADFSTPQTITFIINSVADSNFFTGSLNNLKIKVVTNNP